jgi:saccharopine dehydrogenase-like NADP-dependent oxidoreductase
MYILDNEASNKLKKVLNKYDLTYQLVPPHVHQRNAAEHAIRTFKNHLLAILASCNPEFPIAEWDRLIPDKNSDTIHLHRGLPPAIGH